LPDDVAETDGTPLVLLTSGKPRMTIKPVTISKGKNDLRARPAFDNWTATVRIRFDADQFNVSDVANLLYRAGQQVGLLEGRPLSKHSCGLNWGMFHLA